MSEQMFNENQGKPPVGNFVESEDTINICTSRNATEALLNFNTLRQNNVLVDVVLVVGRKEFPAHRALLASCSKYFRTMFASNTAEAQQRIKLRNLRPNAVSAILDFMYTSEIELTEKNVEGILSAATDFQMNQIIKMCMAFLRRNLTDKNFVTWLNITKRFSFSLLNKFVLLYISNNLLKLSKTTEFQCMTETQIREVLSGEFPVALDELEVLGVLLRLYRTRCADAEEETENMLALINNTIRFNLFTLEELLKFCNVDEFQGLVIGAKNLGEHLVAINGGVQPLCETSPTAEDRLKNYRGLVRTYIIVGGSNHDGVTNDVTFCFSEDLMPNANIENGKRVYGWHRLTTVPHAKQQDFACAVLHGKLYVVGGYYDSSRMVHNYCFCYCPIEDDWNSTEDMLEDRRHHTVNVIAGNLMAVGGDKDLEKLMRTKVSSTEAFDPASNEWRLLEALPEFKRQHASAVIGNMLYVSGGMDRNDIPSDTFWCFDWNTQNWQPLPPMQYARVKHSMVAIDGKLYVLGGFFDLNRAEAQPRTIECFENNGWRTVTMVPNSILHYSVHVDGTRLIIVGGHDKPNILKSTVSYYDVATNKWGNSNFTNDIWNCGSEVLYVPRYLGFAERNFKELKKIENIELPSTSKAG